MGRPSGTVGQNSPFTWYRVRGAFPLCHLIEIGVQRKGGRRLAVTGGDYLCALRLGTNGGLCISPLPDYALIPIKDETCKSRFAGIMVGQNRNDHSQ